MAQNVPINLMPDIAMKSANLFHSITEVQVFLSPVPLDGDTYKLASRKTDDGGYIDLLSPTAVGLSKLMTAAGIQAIPEWNHPINYDLAEPRVINWNFGVLWIQPDGVELRHAASYLLDLRDWIETSGGKIRGPRFEQSYQKVKADTLLKWAQKDGVKVAWNTQSELKFSLLLDYENGLSEERKAKFDAFCNEKAYQSLVDMRVHIERRAQTGAMDAALRKILKLKTGYTAQELKQGFTVFRTRFDRAAMIEILGPEMTQQLALAAAAKALGVNITDIRAYLPGAGPSSAEAVVEHGPILPAADDHPPADEPLTEYEDDKAEVAVQHWRELAKEATEAGVNMDFEVTADDTPETLAERETFIRAEIKRTHPKGSPVPMVVENAAPSTAEPSAPPTMTELFGEVTLPWSQLVKASPDAKLDAKRDDVLIARVPTLIKPKPHLMAHLKKHYGVDKYGQMTVAQGMALWAHLNVLEFPPEVPPEAVADGEA